jgi:hypothetical protein
VGNRITSKGRVATPVETRKAASAGTGTELDRACDSVGRRIITRKSTVRAHQRNNRFAAVRGNATGGMATDKIMVLTRIPDEAWRPSRSRPESSWKYCITLERGIRQHEKIACRDKTAHPLSGVALG